MDMLKGEPLAEADLTEVDPTRRVRRRRVGLVVVATVLVIGLALAGAHAVGYRLNLTTAQVPVPTREASPEEVVLRYVQAYNSRDWATLAQIYPAQSLDRHRAIGSISHLTIVSSRALTSAEASTEYGNPAEPDRSYYEVGVRLHLDDLSGSDLAYRSGANGWTYRLERDIGGTGPWQITDHGNG